MLSDRDVLFVAMVFENLSCVESSRVKNRKKETQEHCMLCFTCSFSQTATSVPFPASVQSYPLQKVHEPALNCCLQTWFKQYLHFLPVFAFMHYLNPAAAVYTVQKFQDKWTNSSVP